MSRWLVVVVLVMACRHADHTPPPPAPPPVAEHSEPAPPDRFVDARTTMVDQTIAARGVTDPRVLAAMLLVPRHEFVPPQMEDRAYEDAPLPIGFGLTISQPYIVAVMTEAAKIKWGSRVLEIGTGSGYQAAVLARMGAQVYTIEIHPELAKRTRAVLARTGFGNVQLRTGDGYFGWRDAAPFDAIIVTAAAPEVPPPLLEQLAIGGHMVIPVGEADQRLEVITRGADGSTTDELFEVLFGPMIGEARRHR